MQKEAPLPSNRISGVKHVRFRPTAEDAMSYFVGGDVVDNGYTEDAGFAINGGKGWADC